MELVIKYKAGVKESDLSALINKLNGYDCVESVSIVNNQSELGLTKQENDGLKGRYDNVSELLALICGPEFESKHGTHNAVNRAVYNYNELKQEKSKLIEALKPFSDKGDQIIACEEDPNSMQWITINRCYIKASQTMMEVCGEEKNINSRT